MGAIYHSYFLPTPIDYSYFYPTKTLNQICMKKFNNFIFLSAICVVFALYSCEGPAGPAGKDANETCKLCHNPEKVDLISVQYDLSKHGYGEAAFEEAGSNTCGPCHLSESFKDVCKRNVPSTFTLNSTTGKYVNDYYSTTSAAYGEISCFTCHDNLHTSYDSTDFSPLTTTAEVSMTMWGGAKSINLTQGGGKSNLCVKCHQPRPFTNALTGNVLDYASLASNPTGIVYDGNPSGTTNIIKPSYRTHTHYGTVGAIVAGKGGVEFSGTLSYTSSTHTTAATCQDCHMAPMTGKAGGHTFFAKGNFKGCTTCHPTVTSATSDNAYWATPRAEIKTLLGQLAAKLKVSGVEIMNRNGDSSTNLWYGVTTNNYDGYLNVYDPITNPAGQTYNTSSFKYAGTPPSTWSAAQIAYNATLPTLTLTNAQMGAIINFQLCLREYSLGIHNYKYTKALLTNSIAALP